MHAFLLPFRCLAAGKGDVAFLPSPALSRLDPRGNATEYELLCPDGGRASTSEWQRCNLGLEPPRVILGSAANSVNTLEELTHATLAASSLYSKRPDLLHLFGTWAGQSDLLFKVTPARRRRATHRQPSLQRFSFQDDAKGLVSIDASWNKWNDWQETQRAYAAAR